MSVVEIASFIAAPSCALHLAQMGAEVVRIDQIGGGPDYRRWPLSPDGATSLYWEGLNKGKKSVALDLGRPAGREIAVRIATADGEDRGLLVTNFPADGFLAFDKLVERRRDMICVRVMGWPDGRTAVDYTVNAALGVPLMTGPVGSAEPVNHVLPAWDLTTGAYAAFCLLAAERFRRQTGEGQEVAVPLSDVAFASLGMIGQIAETELQGHDRARTGNDLFGAFGRDFVTHDRVRLMVVAITQRQWKGLVSALGLQAAVAQVEEGAGVTFAKDEGVRFEHRARLTPLFEAAIAGRTVAELALAFEAQGVCWSRYGTLHEALVGELAGGNGDNAMLAAVEHRGGLRYATPGAPATLAGRNRSGAAPAVALGQDTEEVLADRIGLSGGEIARLFDEGVAASPKGRI